MGAVRVLCRNAPKVSHGKQKGGKTGSAERRPKEGQGQTTVALKGQHLKEL